MKIGGYARITVRMMHCICRWIRDESSMKCIEYSDIYGGITATIKLAIKLTIKPKT